MALRERTGTLDLESRPSSTTRDKKLNFLQRWAKTMNHPSRPSDTTNRPTINSHPMASTAAASVPLPMRSTTASSRSPSCVIASRQPQTYITSSHQPYTAKRHMVYSSPTTSNLFEWMQTECPGEILPRILAFAGPRMATTLSKTNHFWNDLLKDDATWRIMCEELYKWKEGDEIPGSWKDFYKYNPCVPVDYSTVHAALSLVDVARRDNEAQPSTVRLLLRPGRYILREAITIQDINDNSTVTSTRPTHRSVAVEVATMEHFPEIFFPTVQEVARSASCSPAEPAPSKKRKASIRQIFQCRTVDVEENNNADNEPVDVDAVGAGGIPPELLLENHLLVPAGVPLSPSSSALSTATVKRASLILKTRRHNEPLIRARQGSITIRNIELKHNSIGTDIWNGNAAVQLQPPVGPDEQPIMSTPAPTVFLDRVDVTSASGRGIVNIDGGLLNITNSYIHDCAATGVYVGGPGSRANIERTDVVRNGYGNNQHRRGIARGHSGIYLEQGHASIIDCNVSQNSLTGISAVSPENAVLTLQDSDLMSNGTFQLEMPAAGTVAHRNSSTSNITLATTGLAPTRSGLVTED
ncbi:hypothetical protein IV203_010291 [Nitzschia inconspicua]|uniref:Right handed beta helix domain-containing protein n=1 Tax=Nitzschia inconspicua TaxID=303405 RepID=A0A9K3KWM4_9STRA|nr:hypothetical protein IV203_010291 [Nitzschia inconspicua]